MTIVTMYRDKEEHYTGFKVSGHSGYADSGSDIICAAISVLTTTTVNSIESIVGDACEYQVKEDRGYLRFSLKGDSSEDSQLLIKSMVLGLSQLQQSCNSKYLKLIYKEV